MARFNTNDISRFFGEMTSNGSRWTCKVQMISEHVLRALGVGKLDDRAIIRRSSKKEPRSLAGYRVSFDSMA